MSVANLISIANELGDDFFKLFEDSNLNIKVTPRFNETYFEKNKDESFEMNFGKLVEDKRIQMIDLEILINKMEDRSKYLKKYRDSLQKRLDRGNLDTSKFKDDFSRFNTEYIEFNVGLKTLILFKKQLSEKENESLVESLKKISVNLAGTGFSGQFSYVYEN